MTDLLTEIGATRCIVVFGSVVGKNHREMLARLASVAEQMVIARPGTFKPSDLSAIHSAAEEVGISSVVHEEPLAALENALERARESCADAILVIGSFYLVGEIRPLMRL
jgi:folylpolyglutamate synthase/dihydropteroate synthase